MKRLIGQALLAMCLSGVPGATILAQDEVVATDGEGGGGGSPYYGYIGVGVIMALSIFAICKSARR